MGQYQEWLHYREVDQQLQAQLETLEKELAQLQEHACVLEQSVGPPCADAPPSPETSPPQIFLQIDNQIVFALADSLNRHPSILSPGTAPKTPAEPISPALFAWSHLPNFGTQEEPVEAPGADHSNMDQPLPATPHPDLASLPEDMSIFFDQQDQTEPQLEIPRWLRNITRARHPDGPIDQETIRTNRLVQRWLERWGRYPESQEQTRESQS